MKTLTITSDDEKALQQVKELAEKLHATVLESEDRPVKNRETSGQSVASILEEWHKEGGLKTRIEDPAAWQREIRKDRKLPFRD